MCGTISPINPSRPAKLTAAPANAAASIRKTIRILPTASPRLFAVSVPRDKISSWWDSVSKSTRLTAIILAGAASCDIVTPVNPPIRKSVTLFSASGTSVTTASIPALKRFEIATPASTTVMRAATVLCANTITRRTPGKRPDKSDKRCMLLHRRKQGTDECHCKTGT